MHLCPPEFWQGAIEGNQNELDKTLSKIFTNWSDPTIQSLVQALKDALHDAVECAICIEPVEIPEETRITPCGHVFCRVCIEKSIDTFKQCPNCRRPLEGPHELIGVPPEDQPALVEESSLVTSSKIQALLQLLQAVPKGNKSVIFSQWTSMLNMVEPHLAQLGIKWVRLDGTMRRPLREEVIRTFQQPDNHINVILVSLKWYSHKVL
jgi:SWI/SNF-related matrix-associated actin-dependent regulator of chromatin subfamily A3